MAVQIDRMESRVEILPEGAGGSASPSAAGSEPVQGTQRLKEILRPLVIELIAEELNAYRRLRG